MAEIRTEFLLMADSLVTEHYKEHCRIATGLDFLMLAPGGWIDQEVFNRYMRALKEKGGAQGARIVGTRIAPKLQELFKTFDGVPSLAATREFFAKAYLDSNRGSDVGFYDVAEVKDHEATVITTAKLDPDFHIGVFEGCARLYKKWVSKSEIVETMEKNGRYVFRYTF
jgi:hypothetical protein